MLSQNYRPVESPKRKAAYHSPALRNLRRAPRQRAGGHTPAVGGPIAINTKGEEEAAHFCFLDS